MCNRLAALRLHGFIAESQARELEFKNACKSNAILYQLLDGIP